MRKVINSKHARFWTIAACVLIIFLVSINSLILLCLPSNQKARKVVNFDMSSNADTYAGIDVFRYRNDLLETLEITGWTFSSTEKDNSGKRISLMLKSDKNQYIVEDVKVTVREDIYVTFRKTVPMVGKNHGFSAKFSTFNMKDGVYDLYLYSYENPSSYGWYRTGYKVEKHGDKVGQAEMEVIQLEAETTDQITYAIDSFMVDELGTAKISGWGLIKNDEDIRNYYLEITDDDNITQYYSLNVTSRYDIAHAYGDRYMESGIWLTMSSKDLPEGKMKLRLAIETENGVFVSEKEKWYENEGNDVITYIDVDGTDFSSANTDPVSVDGIDLATVSEDLYIGVAMAMNVNTHLQMQGWTAYVSDIAIDKVYAKVTTADGDEYLYEALKYPLEEADEVIAVYGENQTGFRCNIIIDYIQPSTKFTVSFYAITEDGAILKSHDEKTYEMLADRRIIETDK